MVHYNNTNNNNNYYYYSWETFNYTTCDLLDIVFQKRITEIFAVTRANVVESLMVHGGGGIVNSVFVCFLSAIIHIRSSPKFFVRVIYGRSASSGSVAIYYVLPVLWMTSYLRIIEHEVSTSSMPLQRVTSPRRRARATAPPLLCTAASGPRQRGAQSCKASRPQRAKPAMHRPLSFFANISQNVGDMTGSIPGYEYLKSTCSVSLLEPMSRHV